MDTLPRSSCRSLVRAGSLRTQRTLPVWRATAKPTSQEPAAVSSEVALAAGGVLGAVSSRRRPRRRAIESKKTDIQQQAVLDFIEEAGAGQYQLQQALLLACFFFSEASELDVISPLTTAWRLEWGLVTDQVALLASVGYFGFAAGTLLSGLLGDQLGRRVPILVGYLGVIIGSWGMWGAPSPFVVGVFRALTGFSVGIGVPASLTTIAEIAPAKSRAQLVSVCWTAIALGALYADLGLYLFLPDLKSGDWRSLCAWSAVPAAFALPVALLELEDTPVFHMLKGDTANVSRVLSKMAERNGRSVVWKPPPMAPTSKTSTSENTEVVWQSFQASRLPLLGSAMLDFTYNFLGFGCGYFFPLFISELAEGAPLPPVAELVLANLVAFPALYLAYQALQSNYGYKEILVGSGLVELLAVACLLVSGVPVLPVLGIFLLKITMVTYSQTVNTVKAELFPSVIRVSALSISGTCGRVGALIAPALIEETRGAPGSPDEFRVFLSLLAVALVVTTVFGVALVPETKGKSRT